MSLVLGLLGTSVGLVQMANVIAGVPRVGATTVLGGVGVALITSVFGLLIFLLASVLWFSLRQWHLRAILHPRAAADPPGRRRRGVETVDVRRGLSV